MRNPWIWSIGLGRWWNVHVRLHMFFLLFAVFALYLSSHTFDQLTLHGPNWLGVGFSLVLFVSVLLHEIGHVVVARRLGGVADEIVIGPVGGLSTIHVPYEPHCELVALMAGTLVNTVICLLTAFILVVGDPANIDLFEMLNPMTLASMEAGEGLTTIAALNLIFWTNWTLILVNLIPAFPFDGAHSLGPVLTLLWPEFDARQSRVTICRLSMVISVLLLVLAWFFMTQTSEDVNSNGPRPLGPQLTWFALTLLSVYIVFNTRREGMRQTDPKQNENMIFGYDFSQGYKSLERNSERLENDEDDHVSTVPRPGIFVRWMETRSEANRQRRIEQEIEDERHVDEILGRLHGLGMRSLSQEDRALLDRVSQRYRSRQN